MLKHLYCIMLAVVGTTVGLFSCGVYSKETTQNIVYYHKVLFEDEVSISNCNDATKFLAEHGKQGYRLETIDRDEDKGTDVKLYYVFVKSNTTYSHLLDDGKTTEEQYGEQGYYKTEFLIKGSDKLCTIYEKNDQKAVKYSYSMTKTITKLADVLEQAKQQGKLGFMPWRRDDSVKKKGLYIYRNVYIKKTLPEQNRSFDLEMFKVEKVAERYLTKINEAGQRGYKKTEFSNPYNYYPPYKEYEEILIKDNNKTIKYTFGLVEDPGNISAQLEILNNLGTEGKYASLCKKVMLKNKEDKLTWYIEWQETKECNGDVCELIYDLDLEY